MNYLPMKARKNVSSNFIALFLIATTAIMTALVCLFAMPAPSPPYIPRLGSIFDDLPKPHLLYTFKGVSVYIAKVDLMQLDKFETLKIDSLTFSTKENLTEPYKDKSIDGQVWCKLCETETVVNTPCKSSYQNDRHSLWKTRRGSLLADDPWGVAFPDKWQKKVTNLLEWPKVYFTAGIATEDDGKVQTTTKKISNGVVKVCYEAHRDGKKNLGLPLMGAGAAEIKLEDAIRAVLNGINTAANRQRCSSKVTLLLFPGGKWANYVRTGEKNNFGKEQAKWLKMGNVLHSIGSDSDSFMRAPMPWRIRLYWIVGWQVATVVLAVCVSAFIAARLRVPITIPALCHQIVLFILLSLGIQVGTTRLSVAPIAPSTYCILLMAALIVPVWKWKKLGEIPEQRTTKSGLDSHPYKDQDSITEDRPSTTETY